MKFIIVFFAAFAALSSAQVYDLAEDESGVQYVMVPLPLSRQRRQTTYDISKASGGGTTVDLGHTGTILNDGINKLTAGGTLSKTFHPNSPPTYGGNVGYTHVPSGSGVSVVAQKTPGYGTDLGVQGKYNIWREGKATLDAVGSYNRHYGGPAGTQHPGYYGGVELNIPFGH